MFPLLFAWTFLEQTIELLVIRAAMTLIWYHCYVTDPVSLSLSSSSMNPGQCAGRKVLVDPGDDPHLQLVSVSNTEWISLNVGGVHFRTQRDTAANVPGSLLSELDEKSPFFHAASGQYWFDRNPNLFQHILDLYRYGELHFPHSLCGPVIKRELDFWGIDESHIAACCWNSYREFREQEETLKTLGTAFNDIDRFKRRQKNTGAFMQACFNCRERVWYFLEDPRSSVFAQVRSVDQFASRLKLGDRTLITQSDRLISVG